MRKQRYTPHCRHWPLLLLLWIVPALVAGDPVTVTDLLRLRQITAVDVARDGSLAVYGVRSVHTDEAENGEPKYSYRTHLYSIDLTDPNAGPRQLTHGKRNDSSPTISPDGRQLALIRSEESDEEKKAKPQVWLMPLGAPGEPRPITSLENGADGPVWRPDSKALLVGSSIPLSKLDEKPHFDAERPGRDWFDWNRDEEAPARPDGTREEIRNWLARNAAKDDPTVTTRLVFQGENDLLKEMQVRQLFLIDLERDNQATRITKNSIGYSGSEFSPDGQKIAVLGEPGSAAHPDRLLHNAVYVMDGDGGDLRAVLEREDLSFSAPCFTGDGKALILTARDTADGYYAYPRLARYDLGNKELTWLTDRLDLRISSPVVSSSGRLLFTAGWQGTIGLQKMEIDGSGMEPLTSGPTGIDAFDEGGGRIVFTQTSVANPTELYVREKSGAVRRLTDLHAAWLKNREVSLPEEHWITRTDGKRVQYWVMKPAGAEANRKYPTVLEMHGGPSAMWGPGELSMWHEFQLLCAWGYGVVYANPRGSSGYGYEFQKANHKDWGIGPGGDVLAALDDSVKRYSFIDKDRLFLTGGSYAGYLTAWIVGHDQRFKAAVAQRGVYDLATFYGEGNAFRLVKWAFGGYPWEAEAQRILERESPITYVEAIRTPLLIMHSSKDLRTGVTQGEMLYRSLKQLKRPVEYVRYPNIGHELSRSGPPRQRMDRLLRIIEFFERYAENDGAAPVAVK